MIDGVLEPAQFRGGHRQAVGAHRILGPLASSDPLAAVFVRIDAHAEALQHRIVRPVLERLGIDDHAVEVEYDSGGGHAAIRASRAGYSTTRILSITTGVTGTFSYGGRVVVCTCSIFFTTSIPSTTLPNTAYP